MELELQAKAAPPRPTTKRLSGKKYFILTLSRVWSWIFLALMVTFFSIEGTNFFSLENSQNILKASVPILLMGLGLTFVMIAGGIDLSVQWVMGLSSVVSARIMATMVRDTRPQAYNTLFDAFGKIGISQEVVIILIGCLIGVGIACLAGLINGTIIAKLRVPPFIVTLGVAFVARGLAWTWAKGNVVSGQPEGMRSFGATGALLFWMPDSEKKIHLFVRPSTEGLSRVEINKMVPVLPWPVIITIILVVVAYILLKHTQFGRHTYAIGGNKEAALRAGVPVDRHIIMLYVLSGFTAGMAGFLHTARFMGGQADAGEALLMSSIAAVVIGGVSLSGGEGRVSGTVMGAFLLGVLETGMVMIKPASTSLSPIYTYGKYIVIGVVVILAVLMDQARDMIIGRVESE